MDSEREAHLIRMVNSVIDEDELDAFLSGCRALGDCTAGVLEAAIAKARREGWRLPQ